MGVTFIERNQARDEETLLPRMRSRGTQPALAGVTISGRVVGDDGQSPVARASILLDNWAAATTTDDGSFSAAHAPRDWKMLEARSGALSGIRAHTATGTTVRLSKQASIAGSVRDAKTQLPIAGAEVRIGTAGPPGLARRRMR